MKKSLSLLILLLLSTLPAMAQIGGGSTNVGGGTLVKLFPGAPSGTCSAGQLAQNQATGELFDCVAGAWHSVGGGGGTGCAEGTCIVNAPTADQTITGAHALILSNAGSNFKVPVIGDLESTLDATIQGYYSAPVSLIAKNPSVYSGTAVVTQSDGSTFINGLGVVTLVTAASSGGISGIESDVNTDNVVGAFTGGLSAFQAYVNFNGAGTLDSGFGYYLGQVKSTGVMGSFYGLWENDLGSINGAGSITNPYYSWLDSRGVRRIKEDNTFDSVGQAIEALYNPQFTKYTAGAANYERVVLGQWSGNVAQIGAEAGGTGTLRKVQVIGSGFIAPDLETAGLHAGYFQCGPGSSDSAAPSIVASNWQLVCPASITGWQLKIPAAAATGLPHYTNASNVVTESISLVAIADLSATGSPSSTTFLRGDNTWATPVSGISGLTTNTIPKASSSTAIANSLLTDDATSLTYAGTRIIGPAGTDSGSGGGTCTPGIGFNSTSGFTIDVGLILCSAGATEAYIAGTTFQVKSSMLLGWTSGGASFTAIDTNFSREAAGIVDVGTTAANSSGSLRAAKYLTSTNCSNAASPAVCAASSAGVVAVPTGTNPTLVINTTAVTATSEIFLQIDESATIAATTCNSTLSTLVQPVVTARTAATSFTIQIGAIIATNPACVSYHIVN